MFSYINISQSASSIPFDNASNGFTASDVQSAIEEAKNTIKYYSATGTSTLTRTSDTFITVSGMTHTPVSGTYLVFWGGEVMLDNLNGEGEIAIFVNGVQQTDLTHKSELQVALLLGVIGRAIIREGSSNITGIVTANGTDVVDVRFRSIDGETITITRRSFVLVRIA